MSFHFCLISPILLKTPTRSHPEQSLTVMENAPQNATVLNHFPFSMVSLKCVHFSSCTFQSAKGITEKLENYFRHLKGEFKRFQNSFGLLVLGTLPPLVLITGDGVKLEIQKCLFTQSLTFFQSILAYHNDYFLVQKPLRGAKVVDSLILLFGASLFQLLIDFKSIKKIFKVAFQDYKASYVLWETQTARFSSKKVEISRSHVLEDSFNL